MSSTEDKSPYSSLYMDKPCGQLRVCEPAPSLGKPQYCIVLIPGVDSAFSDHIMASLFRLAGVASVSHALAGTALRIRYDPRKINVAALQMHISDLQRQCYEQRWYCRWWPEKHFSLLKPRWADGLSS